MNQEVVEYTNIDTGRIESEYRHKCKRYYTDSFEKAVLI